MLFYIPVYYHPYYQKLGYRKGLCPNAEWLYERILTIPLYYSLSDNDIDDVIQCVKKVIGFYKEKTPNDFIREPYGVKFKIGKFDFIYVLAHSIFGKRERERILEAARYILVYEYFLESDPLENDIIIAGDFNLPANNMGFRKLLKHENEVEFILDPENDLTTLGKNSLASAYDNFFISKKHTKEFTGKYGVYNYIKNNYDDIRKYISDHIPIFIEVDISMDKF